jgi:plastocyanin
MPPRPAHAEPGAAAGSGSIQGKVLITRKLTSQRMRFRIYPGFKPQPPPTAMKNLTDERENVVVYLNSAAAAVEHQTGRSKLQIEQIGETFVPHVLPIVKGSTVDFPNQDPIFHNVFSLSSTKSFDLGRYPKGDSRSVTFDQPGIVPVFCHLHSNMSAIIMVLDNPFFATPGPDGRYRIDNIPAGSYTLVGWHERSDRVEHRVEVMPGETVEITIVIPIEDEPPSDS